MLRFVDGAMRFLLYGWIFQLFRVTTILFLVAFLYLFGAFLQGAAKAYVEVQAEKEKVHSPKQLKQSNHRKHREASDAP